MFQSLPPHLVPRGRHVVCWLALSPHSQMRLPSEDRRYRRGLADFWLLLLNVTFPPRTSQRRPALSGTVTQRSPLMVSLLPSPKERSPHLFDGGRAGKQNPLQPERRDTKALTEELHQLLASVRWCKTLQNTSRVKLRKMPFCFDPAYNVIALPLLYPKYQLLLLVQ